MSDFFFQYFMIKVISLKDNFERTMKFSIKSNSKYKIALSCHFEKEKKTKIFFFYENRFYLIS